MAVKRGQGRAALVAGATRGAGRGIARMLGEAGFTVFCTGRSTRTRPRGPHAEPFDNERRPETIEDTAELVTAQGGRGIPLVVDHLDEQQVRGLVERIRRETGTLDVLVNDIWSGDANAQFGVPAWETDVERGLSMMRTAVHTHIITFRHVAPLLVAQKRGLVVEVTDGDRFSYRGAFFYDLVKTLVTRMAFNFSEELRPHGVAAVAVTPGFLRSEAMLEHMGVTEANWRDGAAKDPNFLHSETPAFVGRAVAALATDPDVMRWSGRLLSSWGLSRAYGFTDVDGARPDWGAHFDGATSGDLGGLRADFERSHRAFVSMGWTPPGLQSR